MFNKINESKKIILIFFLAILSNLVIYSVFYKDLGVVCRYLDGPHYLEVAKTFYQRVTPANSAGLPEWYFAVHLIGFPFFIRLFLNFLPDCLSMLATVTFFTGFSAVLFYLLLKEGKYVKDPFWLSIIFIFFSPRWWLYHTVAGSEAVFIAFVFASLLFYKKKNYFLSALMAAASAFTRVFGILMFPLLLILSIKDKKPKLALYSLLIPLSLIIQFSYYYFRFGDFFAYFRWNARQVIAVPFFTQVILRINDNETAAAEFFILICLVAILGIWRLRKVPELFWYSLLFFAPIPLLIQVDFSRFFIPIFPFALLIAFKRIFNSKFFKIIFIPLIIIIYIYIIYAIPSNLFPKESFDKLIKGIL